MRRHDFAKAGQQRSLHRRVEREHRLLVGAGQHQRLQCSVGEGCFIRLRIACVRYAVGEIGRRRSAGAQRILANCNSDRRGRARWNIVLDDDRERSASNRRGIAVEVPDEQRSRQVECQFAAVARRPRMIDLVLQVECDRPACILRQAEYVILAAVTNVVAIRIGEADHVATDDCILHDEAVGSDVVACGVLHSGPGRKRRHQTNLAGLVRADAADEACERRGAEGHLVRGGVRRADAFRENASRVVAGAGAQIVLIDTTADAATGIGHRNVVIDADREAAVDGVAVGVGGGEVERQADIVLVRTRRVIELIEQREAESARSVVGQRHLEHGAHACGRGQHCLVGIQRIADGFALRGQRRDTSHRHAGIGERDAAVALPVRLVLDVGRARAARICASVDAVRAPRNVQRAVDRGLIVVRVAIDVHHGDVAGRAVVVAGR